MDKPQRNLTFLAIAFFCLTVFFAPWDAKLVVNGVSVSLGTIYSPIWKPPIKPQLSKQKTIKRPYTPDELNRWEKEGYNTSNYKGELVEFPAESDSNPRPTSVNLRVDSLIFEWATISVLYFGLIFILKPKQAHRMSNRSLNATIDNAKFFLYRVRTRHAGCRWHRHQH
jgi:hypothetical protein